MHVTRDRAFDWRRAAEPAPEAHEFTTGAPRTQPRRSITTRLSHRIPRRRFDHRAQGADATRNTNPAAPSRRGYLIQSVSAECVQRRNTIPGNTLWPNAGSRRPPHVGSGTHTTQGCSRLKIHPHETAATCELPQSSAADVCRNQRRSLIRSVERGRRPPVTLHCTASTLAGLAGTGRESPDGAISRGRRRSVRGPASTGAVP